MAQSIACVTIENDLDRHTPYELAIVVQFAIRNCVIACVTIENDLDRHTPYELAMVVQFAICNLQFAIVSSS